MRPGGRPLIQEGQIYRGIASRYLFPPDSSAWWHRRGSYEIVITKTGRIWFEYQSFLVSRNGSRAPVAALKRAKIDELLKEIKAGVLILKQRNLPGITIEPIEE